MRFFGQACVAALVGALCGSNPLAAVADEPAACDGAWALQVEPDDASADGGAVAFDDAILVADGYVSSESFGMYGFAGGAVVKSEQDQTLFGSTLTSSSQGTLELAGKTGTSSIQGQLVWTKADGAVLRYQFTGQRLQLDE